MAMQQTRSPEIVPGPFHLPKSGKRFLAHFMIRGTNRGAETAAIAECRDMLEVVSRGAEKFPAFHLRNPWISEIQSNDGRSSFSIPNRPHLIVIRPRRGEERGHESVP